MHQNQQCACFFECVDLGEDFHFYGIDSDNEKAILQNAILSGGEAYNLALSIIERQELSSAKSLAGLLL